MKVTKLMVNVSNENNYYGIRSNSPMKVGVVVKASCL